MAVWWDEWWTVENKWLYTGTLSESAEEVYKTQSDLWHAALAVQVHPLEYCIIMLSCRQWSSVLLYTIWMLLNLFLFLFEVRGIHCTWNYWLKTYWKLPLTDLSSCSNKLLHNFFHYWITKIYNIYVILWLKRL